MAGYQGILAAPMPQARDTAKPQGRSKTGRRFGFRLMSEVAGAWLAGGLVLAAGGVGASAFDRPADRSAAVEATLGEAARHQAIIDAAQSCSAYDERWDRC
ncbi:MAG TPA: hypothetical protein VEH84_09660 [Alphaproteobacteria bacterium]|nr:hypothetical protein [Alphaproteobacteria bacterium]